MKRLLSLVLCLALLVGIVPLAAVSVTATSGECGDNLTWNFNKTTRILTISGTGDMDDYTDATSIPWYNDLSYIRTLVIESGVTSIGAKAFYFCGNMTGVIISDGLTRINHGAFNNCLSLKSVTIPDSVTSIGTHAFDGCKSLTDVTIGNGVTSIGDYAFYGCKSLTSVSIPDSVTSIGKCVIAFCNSLTSVSVDPQNGKYDSRNGCNAIIETAKNTLIAGCSTTVIPDNVKGIDQYAFYYCINLTSVTIPEGVTNIGLWAFCSCTSLTSLTVPDSLTSLSDYVFRYCSSVTSVTIPAGVTSIGHFAFSGCTALTRVNYKGSETQWKAITKGSYNEPLLNASVIYNYCEHVRGESVTFPATCTEAGKTEYYCSQCGKIVPEFEETIDALGHDYVNGVCARCGDEISDFAPGDVNLDGKVNAVDTNVMSQIILGIQTADGDRMTAGDLNNDCKINSVDLSILIKNITR